MASPILHVCVGLALLKLFPTPNLRPSREGRAPARPPCPSSPTRPTRPSSPTPPPPLRPLRSLRLPPSSPPLFPPLPLCLAAAFLACLPDLDYLPGLLIGDMNAYHQGPTHSLLFVLLATAAVLLLLQLLPPRLRARASLPDPSRPVAAAVFALIASHLAIDWMTQDFRPPIGCPWLWPFTDTPFHASFAFIPAWKKLHFLDLFSAANLYPIAYETAIGAALLSLAFTRRRRKKGT